MALGTEREHTHQQVTLVMSDTHYMHVLNERVRYADGGSDVGEFMNNRTCILTVFSSVKSFCVFVIYSLYPASQINHLQHQQTCKSSE